MRSFDSKTVPLVTLRERRWWWPCLGDLASLSLCLSEALMANAGRDQAKRLGITLVLVGQVAMDVGRDLVS